MLYVPYSHTQESLMGTLILNVISWGVIIDILPVSSSIWAYIWAWRKEYFRKGYVFKGCALYFWVTPVTRPNEPFISELEYNPRRKNPSPEEIPSFSVIILGIN